jgi:hypothetical protein
MIKVDISMALILYLFFSTVVILILWSFFNFGTRLKTFSSEEKHIWHCNICANTYIDSKHEDISKCPICGSFNEKIKVENLSKRKKGDK